MTQDTGKKQASTESPWSTLAVRVRSAGIMTLIGLACIFGGKSLLSLLVLAMGIVGLDEFFCMVERLNCRPMRRLGLAWLLAVLTGAALCGLCAMQWAFTVGLLSSMVVCVFRYSHRKQPIQDVANTILGVSYVGFLGFAILLRNIPGQVSLGPVTCDLGAAWIATVMCLCASTDIAAYFAGRFLGRHKLAPAVSPKKTIEGSLAGLLAAASTLYLLSPHLGVNPYQAFVFGGVVSAISQVGDLWESALKRQCGVKDSGDLINGHGGVLDRFDSLAFAGPCFYLGGRLLGWF
jgi:phosphatidate cytidylyltransferase